MSDNAAITVSCVRIDASLLEELAELYRDEPYKVGLWDWQFKPRFGRECQAIIARSGGKLIGFNATMPVRLQINEQQQDAVWSCDFTVAESFRGKGIGSAIKEEMLRSFNIPIMSRGIANLAFTILLKKGWRSGLPLPTYRRIFYPYTNRERILYGLGIISKLCSSALLRSTPAFSVRYFEDNAIPGLEIIAALNKHTKDTAHVHVVKDYEYLTWRYMQFPWPAYKCLLITSPGNKPEALLIYQYANGSDVIVTDYLGKEEDLGCFEFAIEQLYKRHSDMHSLIWSCSSSYIQRHLKKLGFLRRRDGDRFAWHDKGLVIGDRSWKLTGGDSDGNFLHVVKNNWMMERRIMSNKDRDRKNQTVYILDAQSLTALTTLRAIPAEIRCVGFYQEGCDGYSSLKSNKWSGLIPISGLNERTIDFLCSIGSQFTKTATQKPILLTATDDGVLFLSCYYSRLIEFFIVPIPNSGDVDRLMHKSSFYQWAKETGLPVADYHICNNVTELREQIAKFDLPFILKPKVRTDTWNNLFPKEKILTVGTEEDRERMLGSDLSAFRNMEGLIVQKLIHGGDETIYFVLVAYDMSGCLITYFAGQKLAQWPVKNGSTMVCTAHYDPYLIDLTKKIFGRLAMRGLASIEYKKCDVSGKYFIIEPTVGRCDHQSLIAEYCGVDLVADFIKVIAGSQYKLSHSPKKHRIWMDEIAFLRLAKSGKTSALNVIRLIGYKNILRVRFLLFRFGDLRPFLASMKALLGIGAKAQDFMIRPVTGEEFINMRQDWDRLLEKSNADRLFMSWNWMMAWWKTWGKQLNLELYIHAVYSGQELVAVFPLYTFKKRWFGLKEYQVLGNAWGRHSTVRSEYISPILHSDYEVKLKKKFRSWVSGHAPYTYFIFSDLLNYQDFDDYLIRKRETGYRIDTTQNFESYKASLSSATRLKVFNRREYAIERYGSVIFGFYPVTENNVAVFFERLNTFHVQRWGRPCFEESAVNFHKNFTLTKIKTAVLSYIQINDQVVSLSYNIFINDCLYNIQSGYEEGFDKKIGLGFLHFGYLIEYSFMEKNIARFDFLAGRGKRSNYKESFRGEETIFYTVQVFPSKILRALVKLTIKIKSTISRWKTYS